MDGHEAGDQEQDQRGVVAEQGRDPPFGDGVEAEDRPRPQPRIPQTQEVRGQHGRCPDGGDVQEHPERPANVVRKDEEGEDRYRCRGWQVEAADRDVVGRLERDVI